MAVTNKGLPTYLQLASKLTVLTEKEILDLVTHVEDHLVAGSKEDIQISLDGDNLNFDKNDGIQIRLTYVSDDVMGQVIDPTGDYHEPLDLVREHKPVPGAIGKLLMAWAKSH